MFVAFSKFSYLSHSSKLHNISKIKKRQKNIVDSYRTKVNLHISKQTLFEYDDSNKISILPVK